MEQENLIPIRSKIVYTITLNVSYFIFGIGSNMLGLTLIDMANLLNVGFNDISIGLSFKSVFYSIGSLICILSLSKFNRQFQFALSFMFLGTSLTLIPISQKLSQYYLWESVAGICSAVIEISCNIWMLEIWLEENHRHMQSLNFFLTLGNILAPLITLPFLSSEDQVLKDLVNQTPNETILESNLTDSEFVKSKISSKYLDIMLSSSDNITSSSFYNNDHHSTVKPQIHIPYAIIGFIIFFTGLIINLLYLFVPYDNVNKHKKNSFFHISSHKKFKENRFSLSNIYYWTVLVLGCTISCFYIAMTINNNGYIQTFGVELSELHLTKAKSSYLALTYSSVQTFSCFCFVFISAQLSPKYIILIDLIFMTLANCLLIYFSNQSVEMLWFSIVLLAIGMSSIYPSLFSYMKQRIAVNNNVGSLIVFSSGLISFIYPLVEGKNIEKYAITFPLINLASLIIMIVLFGILIGFEAFYDCRQSKQITIKKSINQEEFTQDDFKNTYM